MFSLPSVTSSAVIPHNPESKTHNVAVLRSCTYALAAEDSVNTQLTISSKVLSSPKKEYQLLVQKATCHTLGDMPQTKLCHGRQ